MSIRSEAMSYRGDVSYELRELLRKNGMRAQLAVEQDRYKLLVQGHDSPMLSYDISEQQFRALGDGGSNYANKKAYRTFNQIVGKDFDVPSSYVAARNVNGRVAMGLHGYRERPVSYPPMGFLGWTLASKKGSTYAGWPVSPSRPSWPSMPTAVCAPASCRAVATATTIKAVVPTLCRRCSRSFLRL